MVHSQTAFARGLVGNFGLCVGSQEEPEAGRRIPPEFLPVAEVLDPVTELEDILIIPPDKRHQIAFLDFVISARKQKEHLRPIEQM